MSVPPPTIDSIVLRLSKTIENLRVMARPTRSSKHTAADELEREHEELRAKTEKELIEVRGLLLKAKTRLGKASRVAPQS
jgi:hypothetical protein